MIRGVDANGQVDCADDENTQNTYTGGTFALSSQNCPDGQVVIGINPSGVVVCANDQNSQNTYTGADFATSAQTCDAHEQVQGIDAQGQIICTEDSDTTYNQSDFAVVNTWCPTGQVLRGFDANGVQMCVVDQNTQYDGNTFALSNQSCSAGQVVTSIGADGTVNCASTAGASVASKPVMGQVKTGYTNSSSAVEIAAYTPSNSENYITPTTIVVEGYVTTNGNSTEKGSLSLRFHFADGTQSDYSMSSFYHTGGYNIIETFSIPSMSTFHHSITKISLMGQKTWSSSYWVYGRMTVYGFETKGDPVKASKPILGITKQGSTNSQSTVQLAELVPTNPNNYLTPSNIKVEGYVTTNGNSTEKGSLTLRFHYADGTSFDYPVDTFYYTNYQEIADVTVPRKEGFHHEMVKISLLGRRIWSSQYGVYGRMTVTGWETVQ